MAKKRSAERPAPLNDKQVNDAMLKLIAWKDRWVKAAFIRGYIVGRGNDNLDEDEYRALEIEAEGSLEDERKNINAPEPN